MYANVKSMKLNTQGNYGGKCRGYNSKSSQYNVVIWLWL